MPGEPRKLELFGTEVTVVDVLPVKSNEPFCEYELEDGTKLRVKSVPTAFTRLVDQYLPDGRPVYFVTTSPVVIVDSSPLAKAKNK